MKKNLSLLIVLALIFPMFFSFISCGNIYNSSNDNPIVNNSSNDNPIVNNSSDDTTDQRKFTVDLAGCVANIGNATALGISKKASTSPRGSHRTNNSGIHLLSRNTLPSDTDTEYKNYIVMSTTEYDSNAPEVDEAGLTKVTFTKIITENTTTEINGTKLVTAKDGKISINATYGFTYSLYQGETLIQTQVADSGEMDESNKKVCIVFEGLTDGVEYEVNYSGIGVEATITQDDIEAEIDKLYVVNEFTFISFVPNGTSQRPNDDELVFDTDGIAYYDKCDYFSNSERQSFIIDNTTRYVYQIKNFNIKEIQGGCLISADDNFIYDFKINANDEVEIFSLFQNDTIIWYSCFKDKYGNKFIQNNHLNTYDSATNTYFYVFNEGSKSQYDKGINYELTSTNEAIKLSFYDMNSGSNYVIDASIILANGEERSIRSDDTFDIYYNLSKYRYVAYKVDCGIIFGYNPTEDSYSNRLMLFKYDAINNDATYYLIWPHCNFNTAYLEEYNVLIEFYNNSVYYYSDVWEAYDSSSKGWKTKESLFNDSAFTPNIVLEDCSLESNQILVFGISGNTYYDLVAENVNGQIIINKYISGSYKPQIKITLQPINK